MSQGMRPGLAEWLALLLLAISGWFSSGRCLAGPPPLTDDRVGIRTAPLLLLSRADVRADVGLDARQAGDADRMLNELHTQAAALRGHSGSEALARKRAIDEAEQQWLSTRLTEAQRKRLIEIDLQWEGTSALISRPVIGDTLHLTIEQRKRLTEAIAEYKRRRTEGTDAQQCELDLDRQTVAVLTPEQLERWNAMRGRAFKRLGVREVQTPGGRTNPAVRAN